MNESRYPIAPLSLDGISTYSLADRKSKVRAEMFGKPSDGADNVLAFISKLPNILAGEGLRNLIRAILYARASSKPVIWGLGGHVIKVGLGPILVDLMRHGFVSAVAMNGSAAIHDFEVAMRGETSEEVEEVLGSGKFGMARETSEFMNAAVNAAASGDMGLGEAVGRAICEGEPQRFARRDISILAEACSRNIPVTVHVAVGTDIIHAHPAASGESLGKTSHVDFRLFAALVKQLEGGGVYLNVGSAVMLPEVFLKAVSVVRNLEHPLNEFTTANLDFIQHYRPTQNVLKRPTQNGGQAIALTGHHEILVPLLAAALKGSI